MTQSNDTVGIVSLGDQGGSVSYAHSSTTCGANTLGTNTSGVYSFGVSTTADTDTHCVSNATSSVTLGKNSFCKDSQRGQVPNNPDRHLSSACGSNTLSVDAGRFCTGGGCISYCRHGNLTTNTCTSIALGIDSSRSVTEGSHPGSRYMNSSSIGYAETLGVNTVRVNSTGLGRSSNRNTNHSSGVTTTVTFSKHTSRTIA